MDNKISPLAFGQEPTDEELATVMKEALDLVNQRGEQANAWIKAQLATAVAEAKARDLLIKTELPKPNEKV